jgi:hypothetical protein
MITDNKALDIVSTKSAAHSQCLSAMHNRQDVQDHYSHVESVSSNNNL